MIKILLGGSPCTFWSVAQKNNRETTAEGFGWELFKNYLIAKEKFKPDFFLYENNKSAAQAIKNQVSHELGASIMHINSALVSAQRRERFYCFNWEVEQPEDRGLLLQDVLESGVVDREKSYCLKHQAGNARDYFKKHHTQVAFEPIKASEIDSNMGNSVYEIKDGLVTYKDVQYPIKLDDGYYVVRKLSPVECERLQTLPDNYTEGVSDTQRYKGLGNGWTAEVIIHILNGALKDVPRDEEIVVLSMYDGIGTGRYCLDKMGFTNVTYFAYEIDKYAKEIAKKNFPDIKHMGDAFDLRHPDWTVGY